MTQANSHAEIFQRYREYYENLTPESVSQLEELATEDLHFRDPFHEVRSRHEVLEIFGKMNEKIQDPTFQITDYIEEGARMYCQWDFTFQTPLLSKVGSHTIKGASFITCNKEHRITSHIDYWDASSELYIHIRGIGWLFRLMRRMAV
jgi:steroid delta-isomerase